MLGVRGGVPRVGVGEEQSLREERVPLRPFSSFLGVLTLRPARTWAPSLRRGESTPGPGSPASLRLVTRTLVHVPSGSSAWGLPGKTCEQVGAEGPFYLVTGPLAPPSSLP